MKKRLLIFSIITLALINFASAYTGIVSDFFNEIGIDNLFLIIVFLGSFTISYFPLSRIFNQNRAAAGVLAFLVGLGITAGVNYMEWDISGFFYELGIDEGLLLPIAFLVSTILIIFTIWKVGIGVVLIILGILFMVLSHWAYEQEITLAIGIIAFILGIFLWWKRRKKKQKDELESDYTGRGRFGEKARKKIWGGIKGGTKKGLGAGKWAIKKGWGTGKNAWQIEKQVMKERAEKLKKLKEERRKRREQEEEARRIEQKRQEEAKKKKEEYLRKREQAEKEALEKARRENALRELEKKYKKNSDRIKEITKKIGHIPKRGTKEYFEYYQYLNEMKEIEKLLKKFNRV